MGYQDLPPECSTRQWAYLPRYPVLNISRRAGKVVACTHDFEPPACHLLSPHRPHPTRLAPRGFPSVERGPGSVQSGSEKVDSEMRHGLRLSNERKTVLERDLLNILSVFDSFV